MSEPVLKEAGLAPVNGAELYYEIWGDGTPLLLLHAGVADCRMWEAQLSSLARHYRVIRFDLRGFGRSRLPSGRFSNHDDVHALINYLALGPVHLLGISFGGLVALDFALSYPSLVRTLALGGTSVSGAPPSDRIVAFWEQEEAAEDAGDLEGATELNLRFWVDGLQRQPEEVEPQVRRLVHDMQLAIFQQEAPDDAEAVALQPPASERLAELAMPVLLMVGELDLPEKVGLSQQLSEVIARAEYRLLPGVAHMLNMEKPQQFNQTVLEFLARHRAPAS